MSLEIIQRIQMLEDRYNALYNNSKKIQELENAISIDADTQLLINKAGLNNSYELQRADYSLVTPDASATTRGFVNTIAQTFAGIKDFNNMIWAKVTPTDVIDTNLGSIGMGTDGSNPLFSFRLDTLANFNIDKIKSSVFSNVLNINRTSGNIGIGTTSPSAKLDVNGDALVNGLTIGKGSGNIEGNTANGYQTLYSGATGNYNTANGYRALRSNTTGYENAANGADALYSNTTGNRNTANGVDSLYSNTTASYNTANGVNALYSNTTGAQNAANGYASLLVNTTGNNNNANGTRSLYSNTTGYNNTANGSQSGRYAGAGTDANSTGDNSVFLGYETRAAANGETNQIVIGSTAIGNGSNSATIGNDSITKTILKGNIGIGTTNPSAKLHIKDITGSHKLLMESLNADGTRGNSYLTLNGFYSGSNSQLELRGGGSNALITGTGGNEILIRHNSGVNFQNGSSSVSFMRVSSSGVGIGTTSPRAKLDVNGDALINGLTIGKGGGNVAGNTANGYQSLYANTTGNQNTSNGYQSLYSNTTGTANTANGLNSLFSNTTGVYNTANGAKSLYSNTTGGENVANGYYSLFSNTTGNTNTANGVSSLCNNTTGSSNTANGYYSLYTNTTGGYNTANGNVALFSNTTGCENTANGYQSLRNNTTGSYNTANGYAALYSNTTGTHNTINGLRALYFNTTGSYNTANGFYSGRYAGTGTDPNSTGNNSVFIGNETRAAADGQTNQIVIGSTAIGNGSNTATIGNTSITALYVGGNGAGIVLTSPDGTQTRKIIINNSGVIEVVAA
jgi:hypothetical protein